MTDFVEWTPKHHGHKPLHWTPDMLTSVDGKNFVRQTNWAWIAGSTYYVPHEAVGVVREAVVEEPVVTDADRTNYCTGCKERQDRIEALQADKARLLRANHVLRLGLSGMVDSEDALKIADAMTRGDDIDWDQYPEATRKALVKPRVLFASLHNRVLTDAEIDQIIKERNDDRDTAR
jgi:hypothetical protein